MIKRESITRVRLGHHVFIIRRLEEKGVGRKEDDLRALLHAVPPKSLDEYPIMVAKARVYLELPGVTSVEILDNTYQGEVLTKVEAPPMPANAPPEPGPNLAFGTSGGTWPPPGQIFHEGKL